MLGHETRVFWLSIVGDGPDRGRLPLLSLSSCLLNADSNDQPSSQLRADIPVTTFSDGCLGSNNDEGRSEV